jgi:hypothetical protein
MSAFWSCGRARQSRRRQKATAGHRASDAVSGASCFVERSTKLFDKSARRLQIGKAPTIITLLVSPNGASKSGRGAARLVKGNNLTVQFDIQSIRGDRHLDNKGVFPLVGGRLTGSIRWHFKSGAAIILIGIKWTELIYSDPFEKNFVIECLIGPISLKVWKNDRDHVRAELWDVPPVQTIHRDPPRLIAREQRRPGSSSK